MSSAESFYYLDEDSKKTVGPFTWDVLKRMKSSDLITDDTLLLGETRTEWKPFQTLSNEIGDSPNLLPEPTRPDTLRVGEKAQLPKSRIEAGSETWVTDNTTTETTEINSIDSDHGSQTSSNSGGWFVFGVLALFMSTLLWWVFVSTSK